MQRSSNLDNLEPPHTLGEKVSYWFRSLFEMAIFISFFSFVLGAAFEVGSWALHFFREDSWLAFAGILSAFVIVLVWVAMRSATQRLWLIASLSLLVAFIGPFVSHYLL